MTIGKCFASPKNVINVISTSFAAVSLLNKLNDFLLENAMVDLRDSTIHVLEIVSDFTLESFR